MILLGFYEVYFLQFFYVTFRVDGPYIKINNDSTLDRLH